MEVTPHTTEQLIQYLQHLVAFVDPTLMVRGNLEHEQGVTLQVLREHPEQGVVLLLEASFLQNNQDARVLEVIRNRVHHWLSRGLPEREDHTFMEDPITLAVYGSS